MNEFKQISQMGTEELINHRMMFDKIKEGHPQQRQIEDLISAMDEEIGKRINTIIGRNGKPDNQDGQMEIKFNANIIEIEEGTYKELSLEIGTLLSKSPRVKLRDAIETYVRKTNSAHIGEMLELVYNHNKPAKLESLTNMLKYVRNACERYSPIYGVLFGMKMCNLLPFMAADMADFALIRHDEGVSIKGSRVATFLESLESEAQVVQIIQETEVLKKQTHFQDEKVLKQIAHTILNGNREVFRKKYEERGFTLSFRPQLPTF